MIHRRSTSNRSLPGRSCRSSRRIRSFGRLSHETRFRLRKRSDTFAGSVQRRSHF